MGRKSKFFQSEIRPEELDESYGKGRSRTVQTVKKSNIELQK
jgi:hypothetical protein